MRIMQIDKKLKQSIWVILAMPSLRQAADLDREKIGVIAIAIRDSLETIEKEIEH